MLIALDYDGTYTRDPELWNKFIRSAMYQHAHSVICFTMRKPSEPIEMPCAVVYTSRKAKKAFAEAAGYQVDIWIDDKPAWLFEDALT